MYSMIFLISKKENIDYAREILNAMKNEPDAIHPIYETVCKVEYKKHNCIGLAVVWEESNKAEAIPLVQGEMFEFFLSINMSQIRGDRPVYLILEDTYKDLNQYKKFINGDIAFVQRTLPLDQRLF
ncbi:TPA: hypothetical protein ACRZG3_004363 [Escherichia coli]|nr:hypothetical protein [Escherichia coli]